MKKQFATTEILLLRGCYSREKALTLSFISKAEISIDDILDSEIPLKDKRWFLFNSCDMTIKQKQLCCIGMAEIVLEIYEKRYPDNKAPKEAIQAAKDYLNNLIGIDELRAKRAAAAAAAADVAYADVAAYAAAYAAAAAADVAAYAAADGSKNHFKITLLIFLKEFVKNNN